MKKLIIIILLVAVVASVIAFSGHEHEYLYNTWSIDTSGLKEVYCEKWRDWFYGDRRSYIVYKSNKDLGYPMSSGTGEKADEIEDFTKDIADFLSVPAEERADFSNPYEWTQLNYKYNSKMIILYFPEQNEYYFVEDYINTGN